jgi:two-component system phosphate regulon sensor histidine kinase PhoR
MPPALRRPRPIVKHIVTRHRGQVRIESVVGKGTTFSIWLPRA